MDLVGVLEAAYVPAPSDEAWLGQLLEATRPLLDAGLGVMGFFYGLSADGQMRVERPVMFGVPDGAKDALDAMSAHAPLAFAKKLYRETPSCATLSQRLGLGARLAKEPLYRELLAPIGVGDFLSVAATDPSGDGCLVGAPLPSIRRVPRQDAAVWSRVAAHIAAGARLRLRKTPPTLTEGASAVLSVGGDLAHAEDALATTEEGKDALQRAARAMDRARGELRRRDPEEAISAWNALAFGRWSLVDHFDHDGKRYLIARRNDAAPSTDSRGAHREREAGRVVRRAGTCQQAHRLRARPRPFDGGDASLERRGEARGEVAGGADSLGAGALNHPYAGDADHSPDEAVVPPSRRRPPPLR